MRMLIFFFKMAEKHTKNNSTAKTKNKNTNRGIVWPDSATFALLNIWKEETIRTALENSKSPRKIRAVYDEITVRNFFVKISVEKDLSNVARGLIFAR